MKQKVLKKNQQEKSNNSTELIKFISDRFDGMDKRFDGMDKSFDVVAREFIRLEDKVDRGFGELKSDFNQLQSSVDAYALKEKIGRDEFLVLGKRVLVLERAKTKA